MFLLNYIIYYNKSFFHFYHTKAEGLCLKVKEKNRWSDVLYLCPEAESGFCAFLDSDGVIHILCADKENRIIYLARKNFEWTKHILTQIKEDIKPIQFKIASAGNILNSFYSAKYQDKLILVHCILGANAKPENIDVLHPDSPEFSVCSNKIYYTNQNKVLGYRDFSDSKPGIFYEIEKNSIFPYAALIDGKEFLVYKKDDFLYVNHDRTYLDAHGVTPLIGSKDSRITLQWKSGNFIRYLTSFNNATTWSAPMRFINNGEELCRFSVQIGDFVENFYGQNLKNEPVIYGKSNLFFSETPIIKKQAERFSEEKEPEEYKKLKILIDLQKREIKTLKSKIKELENSQSL